MEAYTEIGIINKPHGLAGELKMTINNDYLPLLLDKGYLIINSKGQMIPAFVEKIRGSAPLIIKLEMYERLEDVVIFTNSKVYMRSQDIKDVINEDNQPKEWEGYSLLNTTDQYCMQIIETREYPMQTMLVLNNNGEEVLIPLVKSWIEEVDQSNKLLKMKLPEGLY
jgi:16S rRNA processing protein RimM